MSWFTAKHEAMATYFQIAIAGHPDAYAKQAAGAAFREIDRLEQELSRFVPGSDISRANRLHRGESVVLSPDAIECLLVAADVALATNRAFDPSYASERVPDSDPSLPPYSLDPDTFTLTSNAELLRLDLGAVGKGYALDRAAQTLKEWNVNTACLVAGGSTVLALDAPAGMPGWRIGIGDEPHVQAIALTNVSLSASGTAVKGAHLIDPRTGKPAERIQRAWALAPSAAQSDALSTAFFVMSDAEVAELCAAHPSLGAALARPDHRLVAHGTLTAML